MATSPWPPSGLGASRARGVRYERRRGPRGATALVSALTSRATRRDVAMTGEITLRGRVLPIGGLREKVLAAHRAGIKTFVLPRKNLKDLADVPADVKRQVTFVPVEHMDEVLPVALQEAVSLRAV